MVIEPFLMWKEMFKSCEKVVEGPRHTHVEGLKGSPAGLRDLMQRCWDEKLDNRPDASECYKKLTQLYQKFGAPSPLTLVIKQPS